MLKVKFYIIIKKPLVCRKNRFIVLLDTQCKLKCKKYMN